MKTIGRRRGKRKQEVEGGGRENKGHKEEGEKKGA